MRFRSSKYETGSPKRSASDHQQAGSLGAEFLRPAASLYSFPGRYVFKSCDRISASEKAARFIWFAA